VIMINLFIGFVGRGFIDNAAHLGGLLSGAALALVVGYRRPGERPSIAISWHVLQIMALALVAVSFFEVAKHFRENVPVPQAQLIKQVAPNSEYLLYQKALNDSQDVFQAFDGDAGRIDNVIKELDSAPHLDDQADALRDSLKTLLVRARELTKTLPADPRARLEQQTKLRADFESWKKEYTHWLATSGKQYAGLP